MKEHSLINISLLVPNVSKSVKFQQKVEGKEGLIKTLTEVAFFFKAATHEQCLF